MGALNSIQPPWATPAPSTPAGQQNLQQRIRYHAQVKQEAAELRQELSLLRIEHHRVQV